VETVCKTLRKPLARTQTIDCSSLLGFRPDSPQ
jgi:hypothetical protein